MTEWVTPEMIVVVIGIITFIWIVPRKSDIARLDTSISNLDRRLDTSISNLDRRIDDLNSRIDTLNQRMDTFLTLDRS